MSEKPPIEETSAGRCFQKNFNRRLLGKHLTPNPPPGQADVWEYGADAVIKIFSTPSKYEVQCKLRRICYLRNRLVPKPLKPTLEEIKQRLDEFENEATAYMIIEEKKLPEYERSCFLAYYGTTEVDGMNAVVLEKLPRGKSMTRLIATARGQPQFEIILKKIKMAIQDKIRKGIPETAQTWLPETVQIWLAETYFFRKGQVDILHAIGIIHRDVTSRNSQVDGIHDGPLFDLGNSFVPKVSGQEDPLLPGHDPKKADLESVKFSILHLAESETVLSYWKTLLSAAVPEKVGLIVLTGLKNLPDEPFFPALSCILPLLDELPKGLVGYFATQFFHYRVWWIDHGQICKFPPDESTATEGCSSLLQGSIGQSSEGNKLASFGLVFIPPDAKEEVDLNTTDVFSRFDRAKFGVHHVPLETISNRSVSL